jgi:hypothetical protein
MFMKPVQTRTATPVTADTAVRAAAGAPVQGMTSARRRLWRRRRA